MSMAAGQRPGDHRLPQIGSRSSRALPMAPELVARPSHRRNLHPVALSLLLPHLFRLLSPFSFLSFFSPISSLSLRSCTGNSMAMEVELRAPSQMFAASSRFRPERTSPGLLRALPDLPCSCPVAANSRHGCLLVLFEQNARSSASSDLDSFDPVQPLDCLVLPTKRTRICTSSSRFSQVPSNISECEDSFDYVGSTTSRIRSSSKRDSRCRYK